MATLRHRVVAFGTVGRRQRARDGQKRTPTEEPARPTPGGRYTPPKSLTYRFRPQWHKVVGIIQLVAGIAIIVINYVDREGLDILPGGHLEIYFIVGMVIAAGSSWWFGALDRQPSPDEIRRQYDQQRKAGSS